MGIEASLTGHLVFSTLHTNSAPESVVRLLDLGMDPFNFADGLLGVLAQRLVREICTHCTEEYEPTADEAALLRMNPEKLKAYRFRRGRGCLHCRQTGYSGRTGIFEVLPMSERVRALVTDQKDSQAIFKVGREEGMRTLREAAIEKVFQGVTTTTEMVRVTGK